MDIHFRLDDKLAEELKFQAKQNGITLSELCRRKLMQENKPVQIEQVTQSVNTEKLEKQIEEIQKVQIQLYQMLSRQPSADLINKHITNSASMQHDIFYCVNKFSSLLLFLSLNQSLSNEVRDSICPDSLDERFLKIVDKILDDKIGFKKEGIKLNAYINND